jgi:hypothetical protein
VHHRFFFLAVKQYFDRAGSYTGAAIHAEILADDFGDKTAEDLELDRTSLLAFMFYTGPHACNLWTGLL